MNGIYTAARQVYGSIWDREKFLAPASSKQMSADLKTLADGFHKAELDIPIEQFEPGLRVILQVQQELLRDASARFNEGKKDYVMWRLRGMMSNCVACHSRAGVVTDFAGEDPGPGNGSAAAALNRGEFLLATRQFEKAREQLLKVADTSELGYESDTRYQALQLYLISAVRVNGDTKRAAADLEVTLAAKHLNNEHREIVRIWIHQLHEITAQKNLEPLDAAGILLKPVMKSDQERSDEENLVKSLRASTLLHSYLLSQLPEAKHRRGQFLLAAAYYHIPLPQFEVFQTLLLEQVIRENPHTPEARSAFEMFKAKTELLASGAAGLSLEPDDISKLADLRRLAEGSPQLVVPDSGVNLNSL